MVVQRYPEGWVPLKIDDVDHYHKARLSVPIRPQPERDEFDECIGLL
jgi:hypothetical protein